MKDHSGITYGEWTAISQVPGTRKWNCACSCGTERPVLVDNLTTGKSTSCGCARPKGLLHQLRESGVDPVSLRRTYRIWASMKQRCLNPNSQKYGNYAGRGVCGRWLSFDSFYEDMGLCPPGHSIERTNNELGYSKENCTWATAEVQHNNTRRNVFLEYGGKRMTVAQWARELNVQPQMLRERLWAGWSVEKALTKGASR